MDSPAENVKSLNKPDYRKAIAYAMSLPAGPMTLTAIKPDSKKTETRSFQKTNDGRANAMIWSETLQREGFNLYYQDCSVSVMHKRPHKGDVTVIYSAHVDLDVQGELSPQQHAEALTALIDKVEAFEPQPSSIVCTGNGVQCFWLFNKPLTGAGSVERVEAINKQLAVELGADHCHDVAHLMRLPFTKNYPSKAKRAKGRTECLSYVVRADDWVAHPLDAFPSATVEQAPPDDATITDIPDTVDLNRLNDPELVERIKHGPTTGYGDGSRSAFTYGMACAMRERGFSDGEIIRVLTTDGYAAAEHILDQKQRDPEAQAARVIAGMNKDGVKQPFDTFTDDDIAEIAVRSAYLEITDADKVEATVIDWIWTGHLALGQHTCIAGVQGDGKSQLVYALIAEITTASKWAGSDERAPLGNCVILSAEDTDRDVLVPRLAAAGADLSRVKIIKASVDANGKPSKVLLQRDIKLIEAAVKKIGNVKLISIDPISSYLGGDIDSHNNTELRAALDPVTAMAEATGAAVVSITHFNKASKGVSALNRIMGSVAFTAAPRAAFVVLRDDENDAKRLFLPVKLNLASVDDAYGMSFEIENNVDTGLLDRRDPNNLRKIFAPRVKWLERVGKTADAVLANKEKGDGVSALGSAMKWLRDRLEFGAELKTVLEDEVEGMGIFSWGTVRNAQKKLGIVPRKRPQADGHGPWEWVLPEPDLSAFAPEGYTAPTRDDGEAIE